MEPTSHDVRAVIDDLLHHFAALPDDSWDEFAHNLTWTRRDTVSHICDDLLFYALQLSGAHPPQTSYVEYVDPPAWREGGPASVLYPDPATGTRGILSCLDAAGGLLSAVVATAPNSHRGYHPAGVSNASGFAAMGIAEVVLHGFDILTAHGVDYQADGAIVARVLDRIFPDAARSLDAWTDLLRATGRHPESTTTNWRWNSTVRTARVALG